MIDPTTIDEAANRIEPHVLRTPLLTSDPLSERHGADIAIKCVKGANTRSTPTELLPELEAVVKLATSEGGGFSWLGL